MAHMVRASSGLSYPERFYVAASFVGLVDGSQSSSSVKQLTSKFSNDTALLLYALHQQATLGPCSIPKPSAWNPVELSKWKSWQGLGTMPSIEAMRLFVKILEEEDPGWYPMASNSVSEPVVDFQINSTKAEPSFESGTSFGQTKTISTEDGRLTETQDKDIVLEDPNTVSVYNQWIAPPTSGHPPKARYEHGVAVIQERMYIYGRNHNGRYLGDLHVLDLKIWTWSRVETKVVTESQETSSPAKLTHCAGHSLIPLENKLLSVGGHMKDPSESMIVKVFDLQSCSWSILKTYGKPPISRGGQSATLVGKSLVIFGGQDAKKLLLNDLHILHLDTMTWDEIDVLGSPPTPRSDHAAAVHAERYLLIFGGGSHATCFDDLHVLDLQTMEWSKHTQQGEAPTPRAGHAGVTIGENWYIAGGGDNKSGASETVVLNMSTLAWSVVTSVQGRVPLASEGLSLVVSSYNGEDVIVAFGGYNGSYNNEVNVFKPSHKLSLKSKIMGASPVPDTFSAVNNATTRDIESEIEVSQESRIREIVMDNVNSRSKVEGKSERIITILKSEKEELEASLNKEKIQTLQLKEELAEIDTRNTELYKELQSVRSQLAAEQSRCFKLEVEVAEVRQKHQTMEILQKELELLQRQRAVASEQAAATNAKQQSSGGVWGWLAGTPPPKT
ncbi:PREDICTED: acyl-CoA-binding domain-containing protein 5 [Camelina sativa]|uniref:Acyl-CoA-binding domain-containing protein 5 n=1 Tax=Camelina sativa TaxID=90675 RepID=A0ABM0T6H5_CAMSA|nr:PREDICTED: acyl-CoA-binding domain-containing protein 5 [Camelina sativa]